jgi:transcription initiation factor TFIID TATA-box-binding protein
MPNELKISNITATANLGIQLVLRQLATRLWNVEFNPRRFNAIIMRTRSPRITALIFQTGKVVIVGATKVEDSLVGAEKVGKYISEALRKKVSIKEFKVQNIVASSQVDFKVDLELLSMSKRGICFYEPEIFAPAAKLSYSSETKQIALVFRSGKLIYTGSNEYKNLKEMHSYLSPMLLKYRK